MDRKPNDQAEDKSRRLSRGCATLYFSKPSIRWQGKICSPAIFRRLENVMSLSYASNLRECNCLSTWKKNCKYTHLTHAVFNQSFFSSSTNWNDIKRFPQQENIAQMIINTWMDKYKMHTIKDSLGLTCVTADVIVTLYLWL